MSDWSDFFEDFPEFNPGNYIGNDFAPQRAAELRKLEAWATAKLQAGKRVSKAALNSDADVWL